MTNLTEVEPEKMAAMGWIQITEIGNENVYFEKNGQKFYCKVAGYEHIA